jgi:hypothetical protein
MFFCLFGDIGVGDCAEAKALHLLTTVMHVDTVSSFEASVMATFVSFHHERREKPDPAYQIRWRRYPSVVPSFEPPL